MTTRQEELETSPDVGDTIESELDEPRWSVISFDKHEAGGLKYAAAMKKMKNLVSQGVAGLCIVTDEAAARIAA